MSNSISKHPLHTPQNSRVYFHRKSDFFNNLKALDSLGGAAAAAAQCVWGALSNIKYQGIPHTVAFSQFPHSSIPGIDFSREFDLGNGFRLITIWDKNWVLLLYVDSLAQRTEWINSNKKSNAQIPSVTALHANPTSEEIIEIGDLDIQVLKSLPNIDDWMVFLHPQQRAIVKETLPKAVLLKGVSGSGKTGVIAQRAIDLASKYPTEKIAIFTLNPALAKLIQSLLPKITTDQNILARVTVTSIGELCQNIFLHFDGDYMFLKDKTISTVYTWKEFDKDHRIKTILEPILSSLGTRSIDAEGYVQDEFTWVQSAFAPENILSSLCPIRRRNEYLDTNKSPRTGRAIGFTRDWRELILRALEKYESYTLNDSRFDRNVLPMLAYRHYDKLLQSIHPFRYRCILIDEVQDLGTIELSILKALSTDKNDAL